VKNGDEATRNLNLLTQTAAGAAPFSPLATFRYGTQIGYVVNDATYGPGVFFGDENKPQTLNAARNLVRPGVPVVNGFEIQGVCYLYGPNGTHSTQSNGRDPSTWITRLVDASIGSPSPHGVFVNVALGMAWVASKSGLYRFAGGRYDLNPISQYQSEWARINWAAAHTIQVVDDSVRKVVMVLAPLDGVSTPNAILTWHYKDGVTPDKAKFSYHYIALGYTMGGIGIVQNDTTKRLEPWIAPGSTTQPFLRRKLNTESTPYTDWNDQGIAWAYQTGPMLGGKGATYLTQHQADRFRVTGSGSLVLSVKTLDGTSTEPLPPITLSTTPESWPIRKYYKLAEDVRLYFTNSGVAGAWCRLSAIEHMFSRHAAQRG